MKSIDDLVNFYLSEEGLDEQVQCFLNEAPEGWTEDSIKKFAKTIGAEAATEKGFFDKCVARMKTHDMKDPEGFCADLKDKAWGTTMWRGKDKKKSDVEKAKKAEQNK